MSLSSTLENGAAPETSLPESNRANTPTVGFVSLGCPKNLVDSEVMMGLLHRGGAQLTPRAEDAEILVVNTCSFIDSAKQESVNTILEMVQHKIANGGSAQRLIVAGCLVERYRDEIQENIPEVDAVVGTGELEAILQPPASRPPATPTTRPSTSSRKATTTPPKTVNQPAPLGWPPRTRTITEVGAQVSRKPAARPRHRAPRATPASSPAASPATAWDGATAALPEYLYSDQTPRILTTPRASAYIKIAEGCDHPCSFCIIPQLRGKFRSRRLASIVAEAKSLIAQGVREITLIGQDTTCYGEDLPQGRPRRPARRPRPAPRPRWLRFLYAYPNKITPRLLQTIARHDTIAKYLDVPLQHASANVLKRMRRGGTSARFLQIIEQARTTVPNLVLRTSFIVGFPGETEADFNELLAFVEAARIDWLGVFSYSDEEGAGAFALDEKVPKRTIEARRRKLMKLQQTISKRARKAWIGRELDILVEGESEETDLLWQGRSLDQAPEIDGKVLINDFGPHEALVPGTFYRAQITESHDYDVVARILE